MQPQLVDGQGPSCRVRPPRAATGVSSGASTCARSVTDGSAAVRPDTSIHGRPGTHRGPPPPWVARDPGRRCSERGVRHGELTDLHPVTDSTPGLRWRLRLVLLRGLDSQRSEEVELTIRQRRGSRWTPLRDTASTTRRRSSRAEVVADRQLLDLDRRRPRNPGTPPTPGSGAAGRSFATIRRRSVPARPRPQPRWPAAQASRSPRPWSATTASRPTQRGHRPPAQDARANRQGLRRAIEGLDKPKWTFQYGSPTNIAGSVRRRAMSGGARRSPACIGEPPPTLGG